MKNTKTLDDIVVRIEAQKQRLAHLKAKKAKLESAMKAKEGRGARALDTRRKILAGAVLLNSVAIGKLSEQFIRASNKMEMETDRARPCVTFASR